MTAIQPRTTTITIYQGDDLARIEELREAAERASGSVEPRLLNEQDPALTAAQMHDEFVREAAERAVKVVVKASGRRKWRDLVKEHPPRDGVDSDQQVGVNEDTFPDALVAASIASPMFDTRDELVGFLDSLRDADFDRLYVAAFALNRARGEAPKASLVSEMTSRNDET